MEASGYCGGARNADDDDGDDDEDDEDVSLTESLCLRKEQNCYCDNLKKLKIH